MASADGRNDDVETGTPDVFAPGVYLVATPIGNLDDITVRALKVLAAANVLACEDTRVTRRLFLRHKIAPPKIVVLHHEHNEESSVPRLLDLAAAGNVVAVVTDAGVPGVSDPGFRLALRATERGISVTALPGACAAVTALAMAGFSAAGFRFFGFPPRRPGKLAALFREAGGNPGTLVFYESPRRLGRFFAVLAETLGERRAAVCLELTKRFERVERGTAAELAVRFAGVVPKGEATVLVAGNGDAPVKNDAGAKVNERG